MTETVFISGASGFIAQHIVKLLISKGFNVVGTVRLTSKGEKLKQNLKSVGSASFEYEIVGDISAPNSFDEVFAKYPEITVVLHTASPFFYDTTDPEKDLIIPAIKGTENIMNVIKSQVAAGKCNIKRVVITSSDAALYSAEDEQNAKLSFDESSWNDIPYEEAVKDPISAYYGAKSYAEKAAWKIASSAKGFPTLTAVNPVYVFGPQAFENEVSDKLNTSNEVINSLIQLAPDGSFDNDKGGFIDVRDVARAHLAAFEQPLTFGKRLYMTNGKFSVQMMLDAIHKNFKLKIPIGTPGSGPNDILTLAKTSNDKTRELLGFEFLLLEAIVVDVVKQILQRQQKL